jgi:hypothetical protein
MKSLMSQAYHAPTTGRHERHFEQDRFGPSLINCHQDGRREAGNAGNALAPRSDQSPGHKLFEAHVRAKYFPYFPLYPVDWECCRGPLTVMALEFVAVS